MESCGLPTVRAGATRADTQIILKIILEFMDLPKRRLVTYVSEETHALLEDIAQKENRSISSIAEMKIVSALKGNIEQTSQAQDGTDRHYLSDDQIKKSVLEVISTLPDENLLILGEKLSGIMARHGQAQNST